MPRAYNRAMISRLIRFPVILVLLVLGSPLLAIGCGGDSSAQSGNSPLLIDAEDLPGEARTIEGLSDRRCDPLEVLDDERSKAAKSAMLAIGKTRVREAVGVFPGEGEAVRAYDALNARSRMTCIGEAIAERGAISVRIDSPDQLEAGDKGQAIRFEAQRESGDRNSIEVVSIRSGRSVASLIFLSPTERPPPSLVRRVIGVAAGLLARGRSEG